jgi:hypothetical protein
MVKGVRKLELRFSDAMLDLDAPITVTCLGKQVFSGTVARTIATIARTLEERNDPALIFSSEATVTVP